MNEETLADGSDSSRFRDRVEDRDPGKDRSPMGSSTPSPATPGGSIDLSGLTLGGYKLVRKIAEGGMGQVFEALQPKLARKVAVKVLSKNLLCQTEFLQRFEREAKTAAALNHPNIVQIFDCGEDQGWHYLVMELVDGEDLSSYIQRRGKLEVGEALDLVEQAALGLKAAHEKSIVHRDIKPSNLLRTREGVVKVSDLGLAKSLDEGSELTLTGAGIGSPHYLAPEQADDASTVDHRADIYALGITLFFLLTGKRPFDGGNPFSVVLAKASKPMPTGEALGTKLPAEVEKFIRGMAATDPADRYPDYDALLKDLRQVKAKRSPGFSRSPASKPFVINRRTFALGAVLAVVAGLSFAIFSWPKKSPLKSSPETSGASERGQDRPLRPAWDRRRPPGPEGPPPPRRRFPLPRPAEPNFSPLPNGPVPQMLAQADAFAEANPGLPRSVLDRYFQIMENATSTQWEPKVAEKIEIWNGRLHAEAQKAITSLKEKTRPLVEANKPDEAFELWRGFPEELRTREVDDEIERAIESEFPRSFQPRKNPPNRK